MDRKRVIGEVAARHGVRLDEDDPALVLVTLTELMLEQARADFEATAQRATAELLEAAERVQYLAGIASAKAAKATAHQEDGSTALRSATEQGMRLPWYLAGVISALALFLAGIWMGKVGM